MPKGKSKAQTKAPPKPQTIAQAKHIFQDAVDRSKVKMTTMQTVDGFDNFLSRVGLGTDNQMSASTYAFNLITRNRILLEAAYRGSWIVGKVIDCVAEDMTREGIEIVTSEEPDLADIQTEISRLQIASSLKSLEQWGRLYGGAIGVVQIKGQDLATPLDPETIGEGQFQGLVVYDRWQVNPILTDVIDSGPEMGLPKFYDIINNPVNIDPSKATATGQLRVHHSRVIRDIGIELPYFQAITEMMWGESILERLWDRLISFDNVTMSAAQLVDRANLRTVRINGFREVVAAGGKAFDGLVAQFDVMREYQNNEGLTLLDKDDEFASTAYSFAGLSDMMLQFSQQVSGACDTPMVRLFSQSPAGLNATGDADLRMYYDMIKAKQESKFRKGWELILKCLWPSVYGEQRPDDLKFTFKPLWQMPATDKAVVAKSIADTLIELVDAGLMTKQAAMRDLQQASAELGLFSNITDDDIKDAEMEEPPEPDAPPSPDQQSMLPETGSGETPRKEEQGNPKSNFNDRIRKWLGR